MVLEVLFIDPDGRCYLFTPFYREVYHTCNMKSFLIGAFPYFYILCIFNKLQMYLRLRVHYEVSYFSMYFLYLEKFVTLLTKEMAERLQVKETLCVVS